MVRISSRLYAADAVIRSLVFRPLPDPVHAPRNAHCRPYFCLPRQCLTREQDPLLRRCHCNLIQCRRLGSCLRLKRCFGADLSLCYFFGLPRVVPNSPGTAKVALKLEERQGRMIHSAKAVLALEASIHYLVAWRPPPHSAVDQERLLNE